MRRHRRLHRRERQHRNKVIVMSLFGLVLLLSCGYAAFQTSISLSAKGTIKKKPVTLVEHITSLVNTTDDIFEDDYGNIRYRGSPTDVTNNYVNFNSENDGTAAWQIIGVFTVDGEQKVKLIRSSALTLVTTDNGVTIGNSSGFYWNYVQASGKNYNDWETATLNTYLNGTYLSSMTSETQSQIEDVTYYLGGPSSSNYKTLTASGYYDVERDSSAILSGNSATWKGKIALMYPSDYGYAATSDCYSTALYSYYKCSSSDWLLLSSSLQWFLTPNSSDQRLVSVTNTNGNLGIQDNVSDEYTRAVRPTLYLSSNVLYKSGNGTIDSPFEIELKS